MRPRPLSVLLLLAVLSTAATGGEVRQPLQPDPHQPPAVEGVDTPVADGTPQAWALAVDAVLTEEAERSHHLLAGQYLDAEERKYATDMLSQWWGIDNAGDVQRVLDNLENRGSHARFDEIASELDRFPESLYPARRSAAGMLGNDVHAMDVVHDNYRALGSKSLLGWDLMRYIDVNRKAYAAGYLTQAQAWTNIMKAARRLQATFGSWQELGDNYLLGRNFWSESQYQKRLKWTQVALDRLLHDPQSPWALNPWNMNLADASPPKTAAASLSPAAAVGSGTRSD